MKEKDFPASKARKLGEYLGIEPGRISTLEKNSGKDAEELLSVIINEWLYNDVDKSLDKLAEALEHCDHKIMAKELLEKKVRRLTQFKKKVFISVTLYNTSPQSAWLDLNESQSSRIRVLANIGVVMYSK